MTRKRRIPTKAELVQLQKLYKTDEKIGERLGGVPAYLVAYWRRKKNVPRHSQPKFSEREIRSLWERFGDDDRCGLELGISKAAFYNWRRKYGIREKPAFLKLEQLELAFPGEKTASSGQSLWGQQTAVQKLFARAAGEGRVEAGQEVEIEPDLAVAHENGVDLIEAFGKMGVEYVWNSAKIALALDNVMGAVDVDMARAHKKIRDFAGRQRLKALFDFVEGCPHQVMVESGTVAAGRLAVGTDERISSLGCLSGIGIQLAPEAMARLWAIGKTAAVVPGTMRVDVNGRRMRGVYTKDIALSILAQMGKDDVAGKVVEYHGSSITQMNISERYTLSLLTAAMRTAGAMCQFDSTTRRFLNGRATGPFEPVMTDKNATYDQIYQINIEHIPPQIKCPGGLDQIKPVAETTDVPISLVLIGTGCNGRFDDLRIAADILKGNRVHENVRLIVYPASRTVYLEALKKGLVRVFAESGAIVAQPGFGIAGERPWLQMGPGERCLATCGIELSEKAQAADLYISSPATAAATALTGVITEPNRFM
ncbi:MAG TPA: aconitase family protein [candidate division Zixibacteria bacterium]|nr:aconitase family protein [candidate division Zixibacteria bacterium]